MQGRFDRREERGTVTRGRLLNDAVETLERASFADPRRNAEWLLCEVLDCDRVDLYVRTGEMVAPSEVARFQDLLLRRLSHEPLQYIVGYTEFFRLRIRVTPAVLIPRPETEQVVERALELITAISTPTVLDIGTGSGCIALAIKHERPDAQVWACDVSPAALDLARHNAEMNALELGFFEADVLSESFLRLAPRPLDLIVSNPPYVPEAERTSLAPEVRDFEPAVALFAGGDPLIFYRRIAVVGKDLLRPEGWLVFETHADTGSAAGDIVLEASYSDVRLEKDYAGYPRILSGRWSERRP